MLLHSLLKPILLLPFNSTQYSNEKGEAEVENNV